MRRFPQLSKFHQKTYPPYFQYDISPSIVLSSGLAGLSGVLVGALGSVHSELGWQYILTILAVSVMGGVGNLYGVLASGLILGLVMDLSSLFIPSKYGMVLVFSVIILILLFRPQGLFSTRLQQRES